MSKKANRKNIERLIWLFTIVYYVSYVSRQGLGTILVEVVQSGFAEKTAAALALTVSSMTYGGGQIISGYLSDRFPPEKVMLTGLLLTTLSNLAVFAMPTSQFLVLVWGINGFAQALMWPPLVRLMSSSLSAEDYDQSCVRVSQGGSVGTITLYLVAPIIISVLNFRYVFLFSGLLALAISLVWKKGFPKSSKAAQETASLTERKASDSAKASNSATKKAANSGGKKAAAKTETPEQGNEKFGSTAMIVTIGLMLAIIMQGSLRDGVTNWTPTMLSETFHLSSSVSILSGVVLPLFAVLTSQLTSWIHRRFLKNEILCAAVIFLTGCGAAILLALFNGRNSVLSILCLAILVGCMHGVNLILVCMIPANYKKYGHISLISGVLNSATYVGAAVSTYGIAVYAEAFGWGSTILLWAGIAGIGGAICLGLLKFWKKFKA